MNKKLKFKLQNGSIKADELRTLLKQESWLLERTKGSHQIWVKGVQTFVLATHLKELKRYQIKEAQSILLGEDEANGK